MRDKAVILLSGGLDSLAALGYVLSRNEYDIVLALTFDYGQNAVKQEIIASSNIAKHYNIEHRVIKLDWLKQITKNSLTGKGAVPTEDLGTEESMKSVWIPNRNGLFLNIAAAFCDAYGYKHIIYGANKDEGATFPDNTENFRSEITNVFKTSTLVKPDVIAPLINYGKDDIVKIAIDNSVPLEYVWSCYNSGERHCGECESCCHLKNALIANHCERYLELLFGNENKVY